ncbi:MAG: hypothetical protein ACREBW_09380 [Candidatus Micrarchaeaceae archaeon]
MKAVQQVYIPKERVKRLRAEKALLAEAERRTRCKIRLEEDDIVGIDGEAYGEFNARNVIQAFGRGFEMEAACKLCDENYYFNSIDLEQIFGSEKRILQVKARIIGERGKTKRYIESVSMAKISVYGNTVSLIGTIEEMTEAKAAIDTIIEGGTHKLAYIRMEAAHRKNKEEMHRAGF